MPKLNCSSDNAVNAVVNDRAVDHLRTAVVPNMTGCKAVDTDNKHNHRENNAGLFCVSANENIPYPRNAGFFQITFVKQSPPFFTLTLWFKIAFRGKSIRVGFAIVFLSVPLPLPTPPYRNRAITDRRLWLGTLISFKMLFVVSFLVLFMLASSLNPAAKVCTSFPFPNIVNTLTSFETFPTEEQTSPRCD